MLPPQSDAEVKKIIFDLFGAEFVSLTDKHFSDLNTMRLGCPDNLEFLCQIRKKYQGQDEALIIAAILYGMKLGELAAIWVMRQPKGVPNAE